MDNAYIELTDLLIRKLLPSRPLDSNKGTFGKTLVFAGSELFPGAAYLSGCAAARSGVGLVTLAVEASRISTYDIQFPEAVYIPLSNDVTTYAGSICDHLDGMATLLIGPGLNVSPDMEVCIQTILERIQEMDTNGMPQVVVDADGLNNLSKVEKWWHILPKDTILTPHPKEFERLSGIPIKEVLADTKGSIVYEKAREWGCTVVLKGSATYIASNILIDNPGYINNVKNPLLATAGTGDILAGVIAGLYAQGIGAIDAAACGVFIHSRVGELLKDRFADSGMLASDMLSFIPIAIKEIKEHL